NIMLMPTGQVKICDFGVARRLPSDNSNDTTTDAHWTFAGTPAYMAPEVILRQHFDERADLFSLGTVFYEMVTGRNPFLSDNIMATTARVVSEAPVPVGRLNADTRLERVITRLLAKDPNERNTSALQLVEDLKAAHRSNSRFQDLFANLREALAEHWWMKAAAPLFVVGVVALAL